MNRSLDAPTFTVGYREAEFTKFVDNSFHALKVAYANEIGRVCVKLGIDAKVVHKIFVSDTKLNISPYYLRPGGPFGGSCLPKDVRALQYIANDIGANTHVIDALMRSNDAHKHFLFSRAVERLPAGRQGADARAGVQVRHRRPARKSQHRSRAQVSSGRIMRCRSTIRRSSRSS